jgi:hypothetical protein
MGVFPILSRVFLKAFMGSFLSAPLQHYDLGGLRTPFPPFDERVQRFLFFLNFIIFKKLYPFSTANKSSLLWN